MPLPDYLLDAIERSSKNLTSLSLNSLRQSLSQAVEEGFASSSREDRAELADAWLRSAILGAHYHQNYYVDSEHVRKITGLLVENYQPAVTNDTQAIQEAIMQVTRHEPNAQVLAFICLKAIDYADFNWLTGPELDVVKIVSAWANEPLVPDESLTLQKITDLLYGPAAYSLYINDVSYETELPAYLFKHCVPVKGPSLITTQTYNGASITLPGTLLGPE